MVALNFTQVGDSYIATPTVNADFNIHLESAKAVAWSSFTPNPE